MFIAYFKVEIIWSDISVDNTNLTKLRVNITQNKNFTKK